MAEYSWDHVHIKTYDVKAQAGWFQDKLGAKPMPGTEVTAARAAYLATIALAISATLGEGVLMGGTASVIPPTAMLPSTATQVGRSPQESGSSIRSGGVAPKTSPELASHVVSQCIA